MNRIEAGETFDFEFPVPGLQDEFTGIMNVVKYPGDTPAITRALTFVDGGFKGSLTSTETKTTLGYGQWFIRATITDSDKNLREPIKLYISEGWV